MAEIVKIADSFYACSECKNASNVPHGIPHAPNCSLPDSFRKNPDLRGKDRDEWKHEAAQQQRLK